MPLTVLVTFLIGLAASVRLWRKPGPGFVVFMIFFWIVPYSLMGAKWPRYLLSLMPFIYMSAAVGVMVLIRWTTSTFEKWNAKGAVTLIATAALLLATVIWPAFTAYASAPHYALYTNVIGHRYTAYFFPHDEFYDDGLSDAIRFVCVQAPANATIVSETPGVVRYYLEKFGRTDLQARVLSDANYTVPEQGQAFIILQRGRTYFENQDKMNQVRERLPLVYASCVRGHTAAAVYSAQPGATGAARCADGQQ